MDIEKLVTLDLDLDEKRRFISLIVRTGFFLFTLFSFLPAVIRSSAPDLADSLGVTGGGNMALGVFMLILGILALAGLMTRVAAFLGLFAILASLVSTGSGGEQLLGSLMNAKTGGILLSLLALMVLGGDTVSLHERLSAKGSGLARLDDRFGARTAGLRKHYPLLLRGGIAYAFIGSAIVYLKFGPLGGIYSLIGTLSLLVGLALLVGFLGRTVHILGIVVAGMGIVLEAGLGGNVLTSLAVNLFIIMGLLALFIRGLEPVSFDYLKINNIPYRDNTEFTVEPEAAPAFAPATKPIAILLLVIVLLGVMTSAQLPDAEPPRNIYQVVYTEYTVDLGDNTRILEEAKKASYAYEMLDSNLGTVSFDLRWTDDVGEPDEFDLWASFETAGQVSGTEGTLHLEHTINNISTLSTDIIEAYSVEEANKILNESASRDGVGEIFATVTLRYAPGTIGPALGFNFIKDGENEFTLTGRYTYFEATAVPMSGPAPEPEPEEPEEEEEPEEGDSLYRLPGPF